MTNWDIDRSRLLHYLLEGIVILLALLNFTIIKYPEIARGFLLLYLIGGLFYWIFIKKKRDITLGSLVIFSPVVILVGMYVLQLSLIFTLIFVAYLVWRVLGHFHETDYQNEIILFSVSLLIGLFEFIRFGSMAESKYILALLLIQILLTIFIKLNRMYIEMKLQADPSAKKFAAWGFGSAGVLFGSGFICLLFFPFIRGAIFFLFKMIISVLAYLTIYPLSWLLNFFDPKIGEQLVESLGKTDELKPNEDLKESVVTSSPIDPMIFYIIGAVIVVILIAIFFFKKLDLKPYLNSAYASNAKLLADGSIDMGIGVRKKYPVPTNEVRKRVYMFENLMIKYDFGRKPYEPVLEWLKRIEFTNVNVEDVKGLYEKVRYGEMNLSNEEEKHFFKLMDSLTVIAKERYKENKKYKKTEKKSEQADTIAKKIKENKRKNRDKHGPDELKGF